MGLFPRLDSPHYGKAHVITALELESIIHDRVLKYLPEEGCTTTAGPMDTDKDLNTLWKSNRSQHPYYLYIIVENEVWTLNGVVFSKYPAKYFNLLIGKVGQGPNFDFGFGGMDRDGKLLDFNDIIVVKEGIEHTHNPSRIMYYSLLLKKADFSIPLDSFSLRLFGNLNRRNDGLNMSLNRKDNVNLSLDSKLRYTTICKCSVTDTFTKVTYIFTGQFPYEALDNKGCITPQRNVEVTNKVTEALILNLPEYFTIGEITFHYLGGWDLI